ncbi:MAG: DUF3795 domain-containing protein [Chloroflexi bacterium]|nr:DUF3795 domain-containing protein [Chloroflexota bacterium]
MNKIIAYCGLVCTDCPAYIATQADDQAALEETVTRWREEFSAPDMTVADIVCDGCLTDAGRKGVHCGECKIRACGVERGVVNCAHCTEYACEKLENFFGFAPDARTVLDGIRQSL